MKKGSEGRRQSDTMCFNVKNNKKFTAEKPTKKSTIEKLFISIFRKSTFDSLGVVVLTVKRDTNCVCVRAECFHGCMHVSLGAILKLDTMSQNH